MKKQVVRILFLGGLIHVTGCLSSKPMNFTAVSIGEASIEYIVLRQGAVGKDCEGQYGSYEKATRNAIASVEGATALVNAKFSRKEVPVSKICVTVIGDAVKI